MINNFFGYCFGRSATVLQNYRSPYVRLALEELSDRLAPAGFVVDTNADTPDAVPGDGFAKDLAGKASLRAAIQEGNALAGDHNISFNIGQPPAPGQPPADETITLQTPLDAFNRNFSMLHFGPNQITVERAAGAAPFSVFVVNANKTVGISNLWITNGDAGMGLGGGISNHGNLQGPRAMKLLRCKG